VGVVSALPGADIMSKGWVGVGLLMCLCWTNPAQSTPPPERPEPVKMECAKAYPFVAGHAPSESLVDPATRIALCNGLVLPTSLAVAEREQLEAQQPTTLEVWADRAQWIGVGISAGMIAAWGLVRD
jgi:hypothetical protein